MSKHTRSLALKIAFFGLVILFFGYYLKGLDYDSLRDLQVHWGLVALASLIALGFRYWGVLIWRTILADLGAHDLPPFRVLADIYAKAWMARYIPGTVTWIAGKVYMAANYGISKSRLAVSSLLEGGMQIIAITAVSMLLVGFDPRLDVVPTKIKAILVFLGFGLIIFLHPRIFNRLIHAAHQFIKKKPAGPELHTNTKAVVRAFGLYSIGAFIAGTSYYLLAAGINQDVNWHMYFYLVGIFNLAGAIGMAALFVPSGLGVRDGVQLIMLSAIFPREIALVITVASRLWAAAIDVIFYLIATSLRRQ